MRKVVATLRARRVGFPSPSLPESEGSSSSQSAMYSRRLIEWPATDAGVWPLGGSELGKMVEATPVDDRARRRRALRVDVNHDGRSSLEMSELESPKNACSKVLPASGRTSGVATMERTSWLSSSRVERRAMMVGRNEVTEINSSTLYSVLAELWQNR